jgi:hypothetical protein
MKEQIKETAQVPNRNEAKHKLSYFGNSSNPGQLYSSLCLDASSIFRITTFNDLIQFQVTSHSQWLMHNMEGHLKMEGHIL